MIRIVKVPFSYEVHTAISSGLFSVNQYENKTCYMLTNAEIGANVYDKEVLMVKKYFA